MREPWINENDARWNGGGTLNAGRLIYWLTTTIAVLIVIFAVADFFVNWAAEGAPILRMFAFIAAALVWLIRRICQAAGVAT
jgi:hypothetical protein